MRVVLDTNVWVSGLIHPDRTCGAVIAAVRDRRVVAVSSWDLAGELAETLASPRLARYRVADDLEAVLEILKPLLPTVDVRVDLRDPDDAVVVGAALAARAAAIVTGDHDLLDDADLVAWLAARGVEVLTSAALLERLGR